MTGGSDSPHSLRLWAAFALAPFMAAAVAYAAFPVFWQLSGRTGQIASPRDPSLAFAIIAFVAGAAVTAFGAVPLVFHLLRRGPITLRMAVWYGALLGNAPFALYVFGLIVPLTIGHMAAGTMTGRWLSISELVAGAIRVGLLGSTLGAASGAWFWFVGLRERWDGESGGLRIREP